MTRDIEEPSSPIDLLNYGRLPDSAGEISEQATVHSAPFPWPLLFELNEKVNLLAVVLKFDGPFFWQNLRNTWERSILQYFGRMP